MNNSKEGDGPQSEDLLPSVSSTSTSPTSTFASTELKRKNSCSDEVGDLEVSSEQFYELYRQQQLHILESQQQHLVDHHHQVQQHLIEQQQNEVHQQHLTPRKRSPRKPTKRNQSHTKHKHKNGRQRQHDIANVSFSASGIMSMYHFGVAAALSHFIGMEDMKLCGASAGGLVAANMLVGLSPFVTADHTAQHANEIAADPSRLAPFFLETLNTMCPDEAHLLCSNRLRISCSRVVPSGFAPEYMSRWNTLAEFKDTLVASCHIPVITGVLPKTITNKDGYFFDGLLTDSHPIPLFQDIDDVDENLEEVGKEEVGKEDKEGDKGILTKDQKRMTSRSSSTSSIHREGSKTTKPKEHKHSSSSLHHHDHSTYTKERTLFVSWHEECYCGCAQDPMKETLLPSTELYTVWCVSPPPVHICRYIFYLGFWDTMCHLDPSLKLYQEVRPAKEVEELMEKLGSLPLTSARPLKRKNSLIN
eukprot:m.64531 g.64531  ORF g.64531 m.64531 type:complete len:475 (+) comp11490_c0_seq1:150-1574(+)